MSIQAEQPQMPQPSQQGSLRNPVSEEKQQPELPRRRKAAGRAKVLVLVILAFLITLIGSDVQQIMSDPASPTTLQAFAATGPFIQRPLSPDQVNKLHQMSAYYVL